MTDAKYDPEMVDEVVRQMSFSERTALEMFRVLEELGWHPPAGQHGKVSFGDTSEACPTCGDDALTHVLRADLYGDGPDYYECVENMLIERAENGDELATAAMARIEHLKNRAGDRGSMGADNEPSFLNDPGNERWRDTIVIDKDTHPRDVCPYPDGCTGCYDGD